MDGRKNNRGTIGNKGGRKPKAEEQLLAEKLNPYESTAFTALESGLEKGEAWAVKLFFEYRFGKPVQTVEQTNKGIIDIKPHEWIKTKQFVKH